MNTAQAEEALFGEALTCTLTLPLRLRALPAPGAAAQAAATAETLLHSVALVEDSHPEEKGGDEHGPQELALQRLEAKVDLLIALMGRLLAGEDDGSRARPLRWSHNGACVTLPGQWAAADVALLCLPVAPWLPQQLELPVRVLAAEAASAEGQTLWLAIEPSPEALTEALKRHLFRLHRRAIAEEKRGH